MTGLYCQRNDAHRLVARLECKSTPKLVVRICVAGIERHIVSEPVEFGFDQPVDQLFGCAAIKFMVTRHDIHRRQSIEEVHGFHHLLAMPQLAFEGRIQEVTAVQHTHVAAF